MGPKQYKKLKSNLMLERKRSENKGPILILNKTKIMQ